MLQAYSTDIAIAANAAVPFNNLILEKGCTAKLSSPSIIQLNKCGVYMVSVDSSAEAATNLQLYKDGIAQPQAQSTGLNPSFVTLVQVDHNNSRCCCDISTNLQVISDAAATLTNVNIVITKIC